MFFPIEMAGRSREALYTTQHISTEVSVNTRHIHAFRTPVFKAGELVSAKQSRKNIDMFFISEQKPQGSVVMCKFKVFISVIVCKFKVIVEQKYSQV